MKYFKDARFIIKNSKIHNYDREGLKKLAINVLERQVHKGIETYGASLSENVERQGLTAKDAVAHTEEELVDGIVYLCWLHDQAKKNSNTLDWDDRDNIKHFAEQLAVALLFIQHIKTKLNNYERD